MRECYQYIIDDSVSIEDAVATINVALLGVQAVHGNARTRMDARYVVNEDEHTIIIDADTAVGCDLNQLFVQYLTSEFGARSFQVQRTENRLRDSSEEAFQ